MEKTQFVALKNIGAAEKVRLLVYTQPQVSEGATRVAHAPLPALVRAALVRAQGVGWREYADGSLMQWGTGSGIDPLISFPRAFSESCWHVSLNVNETATPDRLVVRLPRNVTRFSFTAVGNFVNFQGGGGKEENGFSWMAWGQ